MERTPRSGHILTIDITALSTSPSSTTTRGVDSAAPRCAAGYRDAPSRAGIIAELKSPELYPGVEQAVVDVFRSFPGYMQSSLANGRLAPVREER